MQNIESITLENWPAADVANRPDKPIVHVALRQHGVNFDFHLRKFFKDQQLSFHYFESFESLVRICQRYPVSTIVIASKTETLPSLELVQQIKDNVFLAIIPVIIYHPDPPTSHVVAAYEHGVEEFIFGEWIEKLVQVRVQRVISRSNRDVSLNPSTRLPGPTMIEQEIMRQMAMQAEFAVCYADLDNFKAFNDYYGYAYGDRIIKLTGKIIRDVVFDMCREGFVGHIAGDDFIFVIPNDIVDEVCRWIIRCFDAFIPYRYDEVDRNRGFITTVNRKGLVEQYPILTISIAVVCHKDGEFEHVGEISRTLAEVKKAVKQRPGSNFMRDRRRTPHRP